MIDVFPHKNLLVVLLMLNPHGLFTMSSLHGSSPSRLSLCLGPSDLDQKSQAILFCQLTWASDPNQGVPDTKTDQGEENIQSLQLKLQGQHVVALEFCTISPAPSIVLFILAILT